MTGTLTIAGLGPGDAALVTPEVSAALAEATDVLGYAPYVARVAAREGLRLHPSDNRQELERAGEALRLAAEGRSVVLVSSGDPGVFAMAAAVFEALEAAPELQQVSIRVLPGVTAMLAAAARAGAPLGHDFCAINLSDNLKPWELIEKRLRLAAEAGIDVGTSEGTPIVPAITADSMKALQLADRLYTRGISANPILHPAVEERLTRLRFFITSEHTEEQITTSVQTLAEEMAKLS